RSIHNSLAKVETLSRLSRAQSLSESDLLAQGFRSLNTSDRLTLAYLLFTSVVIIICQRNVIHWISLLLIQSGLICLIVMLAYRRESGPQALSVLSHWYPLLLSGFFFEEIGHLVHAIF